MAEGQLWVSMLDPAAAIEFGASAYKRRFGHAPAWVRARRSTLQDDTPAVVAGVRVIVDETVQRYHYLFGEEVEE